MHRKIGLQSQNLEYCLLEKNFIAAKGFPLQSSPYASDYRRNTSQSSNNKWLKSRFDCDVFFDDYGKNFSQVFQA